jgi:hypothetical protein
MAEQKQPEKKPEAAKAPEKKTYRATRRGFIDRTYEIGETFQYAGKPGSWMEEVKPEAKK